MIEIFFHTMILLSSMGGFEGFKRTTRIYVNTIERYSIENDQWESFSIDGPQFSSLAACTHDNSIYLGGGKNGQWYVVVFVLINVKIIISIVKETFELVSINLILRQMKYTK